MTTPKPPSIIGGRYRLERTVGRGGMGTVWIAQHLELGVDVALKLMSPALAADPKARKRFRREARAAAQLKSPHVVAVHDFGQDGDIPYLVMELLQGQTLSERLAENGALDFREVVEIVEQSAEALSLAHAAGIVHRDIKPSNLFLTWGQGRSLLKVLDFGIARAAVGNDSGVSTAPGLVVGSPAFMSPEQTSGYEIGPQTDLWSLAAVAYTLLTGHEPFRAPTMRETLARIRSGQFVKPTRHRAELPPEVDAFFQTAFQVNPSQRFRSAAELSQAFARASGQRPVRVLPAPRAMGRDATTQNLTPTLPRRSRWPWLGLPAALIAISVGLLLVRARPLSPQVAQGSASSATTRPDPRPHAFSGPTLPRASSTARNTAPSTENEPTGTPASSLLPLPSASAPPTSSAALRTSTLAPSRAAKTSVHSTSHVALPSASGSRSHAETDPLFGLPLDNKRAAPPSSTAMPDTRR